MNGSSGRYVLLVVVLCCVLFSVEAQDRLVLKFDVGKYRLTDQHKKAIDGFIRSIYPAVIDSVTFRGYADSLGNIAANIALSEKRAREVMRYCRVRVPDKIRLKLFAVGERNKRIDSIDRRVEVVVYNHDPVIPDDPVQAVDTTPVDDSRCYTIAYPVLARANTNVVKRNRVEYVMVELSYKTKDMDNVYYMSGTDDLIRYTKIKWVNRLSGELWWAKGRPRAYIPREIFDKHKIGYLYEPPCDSCSTNFKRPGAVRKKVVKILVADEFLFQNIQVKTALFNRRRISIRVPAQYVDPAETYYANFNLYEKVAWRKKNGKRNGKYLFSKLGMRREGNKGQVYRFDAISKLVPCCDENSCRIPVLPFEYCIGCRSFASDIYLGVEAGYLRYDNMNIGYAGLGAFKEWDMAQATLLAGADHRGKLHLLARYQYNYLTFPFFILNPFSGWATLTNGTVSMGNRYGRLYTGSELRNFRGENNRSYTVHDLHLGFSIVSSGRWFNRFFIQSGLGYDYSGNSTKKINQTFSTGLIFEIL